MASELKSPKGKARRAAIQEEARQAIVKDGYAGVSLRQIAGRVGVSLGNLQYYFATKDDLVEAVITSEVEASLAILDDIPWDRCNPGPSIHAAVQRLLRHHATESGRFYAIAESLALHNPRFAHLKAILYAAVLRNVEQLVTHMVPELTADRQTRLAHVLVALIDGASLQVQCGRAAVPENSVDDLADDVAAAIEQLLKSW